MSKPLTAGALCTYHREHLVRAEQVVLDVQLIEDLLKQEAAKPAKQETDHPGASEERAASRTAQFISGYYHVGGYVLGWHGLLAERWDLVGKPVEDLQFTRLANGQNPHTGEQLVRKRANVDPCSDSSWKTRLASTSKNAPANALRDVDPGARRPKRKLAEVRNGEVTFVGQQAQPTGPRKPAYAPKPGEFNADEIPIESLWRDLGGGELRGLRGRAFWREGKGFNVALYSKTNSFHDFVSGSGGGTIRLAALAWGVSDSDAARRLREEYGAGRGLTPALVRSKGAEARAEASIASPERIEALKRIHAITAEHYRAKLSTEQGKAVSDYLDLRGVNEAVREHFGLGASDASNDLAAKLSKEFSRDDILASRLVYERHGKLFDHFKDRLMIPIANESGEVVAFAARRLSEEEVEGPGKYENSGKTDIYDKSKNLYNYHEARAAQTGRMVPVEGYFDTWAAWEAGVEDVVSPCGTALTQHHIALIAANGSDVVMNFDSGQPEWGKGQKKIEQYVPDLLKAGLRVQAVDLAPGSPVKTDAFSFVSSNGAAAYRTTIDNAGTVVEWLGARAKRKFADSSEEGYNQEKALQWISSLLVTAPQDLRPELAKEFEWYLRSKPDEPERDIAARDLTFGMPKGYSLAALVGGDTRIIEIGETAIIKALDAGQKYARARMGGNLMPENSANWCSAIFRHVTARPTEGHAPNPHLHWHVVIFNMIQSADGKIRAMEPEELFKVQAYMNAIFQAEIAYGVRQLGYQLRNHERGRATEIAGYSEEFLKAMSRRKEEIEAEKEKRGVVGAEADEIINKQIRKGKEQWEAGELLAKWSEEAADLAQDVAAVRRLAEASPSEFWSEDRKRAVADAAIEECFSWLMEHQAVGDHYEFIARALEYKLGYLQPEDIEETFKWRLEHHEHGHCSIVEVDHYRKGRPGARYTTSQMQKAEQALIDIAKAGIGKMKPLVMVEDHELREQMRPMQRRRVKDKEFDLKNAQMWMAHSIVRSADQWMIVRGVAGSGKSSSFEIVVEVVEQFSKRGVEVMGLAATTTATNNLTEIRVPSQTLAGHILSEIPSDAVPRLYVLDEGSLAGTMDMLMFAHNVRECDRVVIAYDPRQHQSVTAGRIVEQLELNGIPTVTLETIVRQWQNPTLLHGIELIRDSFERDKNELAIDAMRLFEEEGWIVEHENKRDRVAVMADFFAVDPDKSLLVAPDNATLTEMGEACRERLLNRGDLSREKEQELTILAGLKSMRRSDKGRAARYEVGDIIRWSKDSRLGGRGNVYAGEYTEVLAAKVHLNRLTIKTSERPVEYTASVAVGEVYRSLKRKFTEGERVRLTRPWKTADEDGRKVRIANGEIGRLIELRTGGMGVLEFKGRRYQWSIADNPHIDWGYATTSHRGQSLTYDRVGVHIDCANSTIRGLLDKVLGYVGYSRAALELMVVTDSKALLMGPRSPLLRHYVKPTALPIVQVCRNNARKHASMANARTQAAPKQTPEIHLGVTQQNNGYGPNLSAGIGF